LPADVRLAKELLTASPRRAACTIALAWLDAAGAACTRLDDPADREALHDFRVALRRLRSTLRAYRPWLRGLVSPRLGRELRKLTRATNAARDAEVQIEWLDGLRATAAAERVASAWLRERLGAQRDAAYARVHAEARQVFGHIERRLRARLERGATAPPDEVPFAVVAGGLIAEHAQTLRTALAAIGSLTDTGPIHAARIEGKRLRYLIEPLAAAVRGGEACVRAMKALQDRFGVLCDGFVAMEELAAAVEAAGAEQARRRLDQRLAGARTPARAADPLPGLCAFAARRQRASLRDYVSIRRHYLESHGETVLRPVERLAAALRRARATLQ
jgi:CHAD domain-containing protein